MFHLTMMQMNRRQLTPLIKSLEAGDSRWFLLTSLLHSMFYLRQALASVIKKRLKHYQISRRLCCCFAQSRLGLRCDRLI